jgi:hypothetical protein
MPKITLIALWSRPADVDSFDRDYLATHPPLIDEIVEIERTQLLRTNAAEYHRAALLTFPSGDAFDRTLGSDSFAALRENGKRLEREHGVVLTIVPSAMEHDSGSETR